MHLRALNRIKICVMTSNTVMESSLCVKYRANFLAVIRKFNQILRHVKFSITYCILKMCGWKHSYRIK